MGSSHPYNVFDSYFQAGLKAKTEGNSIAAFAFGGLLTNFLIWGSFPRLYFHNEDSNSTQGSGCFEE